ncbi:glycosyltransferase family 39 protein [Candidatus Sumerlaeota bacterium]|nr:glycosyltransferase family 39 protein [Candidatus Sumerlaeota bacterium]
MRPRHWILLAALALAARLWLWAVNLDRPERCFTPDSEGYHQLALNLLHHGVFSQAKAEPLVPDFFRAPLYPLLLAAVYGVSGDRVGVAIFVQVLASAATCVLLFFVYAPIVGKRWALAGATVQAVSLSSIVSCQYILTETLFTALLAVQLGLVLRYVRRGEAAVLAWATIVLALMTLCRPISLPWIALQCAALLFERRRPWRSRLFRIALSLAIFAALLFPWYLRNRLRDGHFFFTSMNLGHQFLNYHLPALESRRTGETAQAVRERLRREVRAEFAAHPERYGSQWARDRFATRYALTRVKQYPVGLAMQHFRIQVLLPRINSLFELLGLTVGQRGTLDVMNREGVWAGVRHYFGGKLWLVGLAMPWLALLGAVYAAMGVGLVRWLWERNVLMLALFVGFVAYYLILPASAGEPRFREPAMPMMILAALAGASWPWRSRVRGEAPGSVSTDE